MSNMQPDTFNKLKEAYAFARAHSAAYTHLPSISSPGEWAAVPLSNAESLRAAPSLLTCPEEEVRYFISEFTTEHPEHLFLVPHRLDAPWSLLAAEIAEIKPYVAVLAIPLFWQVAPFFYATFRAQQVPVSVLQPRNLPLATYLINEVRADMVVSTPSVASELQTLLATEGLGGRIRAWHLIVPFGQKVEAPAVQAPYIFEYHLFPGIAVARSMPDGSFVPLPGYYIEIGEGGECIISSLEKHAMPLVRYNTGVRIAKAGDAFTFI